MARESERIENLDSCVDAWVRATQIRDYLSALDAKLAANEVKPTDPEHFPKWRQLAQWYADSVCPVTPTPPRPEIDEPIARTNKRIEELDLTSKARRAFEQSEISDTDELIRLTREELKKRCGDRHWNLYSETIRVLEGLGYAVSERAEW